MLAATGSRVDLCCEVLDVGWREVNLRGSLPGYCDSGVGPIFGFCSLILPSMWACGLCLTSWVTDFIEELVLPAMRLYDVLDFLSLLALVCAASSSSKAPPGRFAVEEGGDGVRRTPSLAWLHDVQ